MRKEDFPDQENGSSHRSRAESDDNLESDLFNMEDDSATDPLSDQFQADGYRVVRLEELVDSEDEPIVEAVLEAPSATLDVEELLRHLIEADEELPAYELFALSDLSYGDAELVRRLWPLVPIERRRVVVETLVLSAEQFIDLQLGTVLRVVLDDDDPIVRRVAIGGLWEDEGTDLLGRYVHMLDSDMDVDVRSAAAAALGPYVLAGELDELDAALAMRAEEALISALTNRSELLAVQCRALESIAYSGELGVRQLIEDAYYSPYDEMRLSALVAMGRSADVRWRRLVQAELQSPDADIRMEAALACGNLETRAALARTPGFARGRRTARSPGRYLCDWSSRRGGSQGSTGSSGGRRR